jgi:CPA2 family monovalent cation:H+ antiporter-2
MLTETEFDHRIMSEIIPMRDLFATLFFVSVGMLIDLRFLVHNLPAVLGIAVFIMAVKAVATALALSPFRMGAKTTCFTALGMISIGEFNFLLAQAGLNAHAIGQELYNLILSSALVTIVLTPAAFYFAPRLARLLQRVPGLSRLLAPAAAAPVPVAGLANHAVVVGYGRVGKRMARGLRQAGLPIVVIEQELRLVNELHQKGMAAIYGDGTFETVLQAASPATARVIVITLPDFGATRAAVHRARVAGPDCLIIARAQRAEDDVILREAGASAVVVPEIAGALMLLEETLLLLGLPHSHIFTGPGILHVSLPRSELEAL